MINAQDNIVGTQRVVSHPASSRPSSGTGPTPFIMPRQTGTGSTRGVQNISGGFTITDPKTGQTLAKLGIFPGAF